MDKRIRVLHVDGDQEFADLTAETLEQDIGGFRVASASTAAEGLDYLAEDAIDCIVSGNNLSDVSGTAFLETVRERDPDLPFIIYTESGSEAFAGAAIAEDVTDYLEKAAGGTHLSKRIEAAVGQHRSAAETEAIQRRYQRLIEESTDLTAIIDPDGEFTYLSPAIEHTLGYAPEELLGDRAFEYIHEDDREVTMEHFFALVENPEKRPTIEFRFRQADGSYRTLEGRGRNLLDDPVIEGLVINARDITERVAHEKQLEEIEERYRQILSHSLDFVAIIDEECRVSYVSPAIERTLGYDVSEMLDTNPFDYVHPEDHAGAKDTLSAILDQPDEEVSVEYRVRHADGDWRWIEARARNHFDDPVTDGILVNVRDSTERKIREERFRTLHDVAVDLESCETVSAVCERTVRAAEDVLDLHLCYVGLLEGELIVPEATSSRASPEHVTTMRIDEGLAGETLRSGQSFLIDDILDHPIPEPVREEYRSTISVPIADLGVFQAVSKQYDGYNADDRELVETLMAHAGESIKRIRSRESFKRQNERLEEFASVVSHDLRNPLNVAIGRAELLAMECESEHIAPTQRALERMNDLIDDLLALARQGGSIGEVEPVDLAQVTEHCWRNVETNEATVHTTLSRRVQADESRLGQLLENLIRNAVEHGGENVSIEFGELDGGFFIEDDGPGIPREHRDEVFEIGFTTSENGTGFGLAIVHEIVEAHGWEIQVTDGEDGGARFEITGVEFVD